MRREADLKLAAECTFRPDTRKPRAPGGTAAEATSGRLAIDTGPDAPPADGAGARFTIANQVNAATGV